ncbi:MAG: phytanoyl-CoA dioxygenase family protein [Armatimonadetes bacterium]|nr:phytanoyl-CoA dioxygenase family protein [Armatimonadota bacterium]
MILSVEQIRSFHLNGFLSIPRPLSSDEELAWMRDVYDRMFQQRGGWDSGDQFDLAGTDEKGKTESLPQMLNPAKYAPELAEGKYLAVVDEIVKELLGEDAQVGIVHAIFKPSGHGASTPWHQDEAYWDPGFQYKSISVWMPLQEATIENGCLWFVPGSHEWEVLPHQSIGGDVRVHGLEMMDTSVCIGAVACPLPPGGVTIHRNRTAHYAGPNTSDIPRRALIMMGGLEQKPYPGERSFPWNDVKQTARAERAARN